jgi:L,D-transpeptidase YcbB
MRGVRYDHILASTALALILAGPIGIAAAQEKPAAAPAAAPAASAIPPASDNATTTGAISTKPDAVPASVATPAPAANPEPAQPATAAAPANASSEPAVAAAPAAQPDPLASLDPADRPIAEKVRDLLAGKAEKIFPTKKERTAIDTFYQNRNLAPLWFEKGVASPRATAVIARLKAADADGLDPADYKAPNLAVTDAEGQAEAELKLTQVVLTYARHVQAGRFPYTRISQNNIELPQAPPDVAAVLTQIADAQDVGKALEEFSPRMPQYQKLKAALAELRNKASGGDRKEIGDGPMLKLVNKTPMEDARVPLLRERLSVTGDMADIKYDTKVAEAVKKFQKSNDLPVTGALDAKTVKELNGPPKGHQLDIILANMERWRWYPRDLGKAYSMVNQPDFTLRVMKDEQLVWTTRVVIGLPSKATPLLSETMKYITVNPTWNVPQSIVQGEYLPALRQDPTVLERMGLKVVNNRDGTVHIYQPPGEANALGRVRFNFPNRFLVYQHDTPDKHLFAHDSRAYSHGCMRVQDPAKYAEVMLGLARPQDSYTAERIKHMFGTGEVDIQFTTPIPVHLTYQTAFVDDDGKLQFRKDVYGLDGRTINAVKTERALVEPQAERPKEVSSNGGSGQRRGQPVRQVSFFEQLFGGGVRAAPVPQRRVEAAPQRRVNR